MKKRKLSAFGLSATLHVIAGASLIWLAGAMPQLRVAGGRAIVSAGVAAQPSKPLIPSTSEKVDPSSTSAIEKPFPGAQERAAVLVIPGFVFDFRKIADRAPLLFPFLTRGLSLERSVLQSTRQSGTGLQSPFAVPVRASARRPLVIRDAALQSLVDESWSRRNRWKSFQPIVTLADDYDPTRGGLPLLLRSYLDQNVLQPYVDTTIRDPRLWTQLGIAADHADFIEFITQYVARHPSTRAATELLFLLDKLAQASLDTLTLLIDTNPGDLWWTRDDSREAHRLVVTLRDYYSHHLERRGLTSREALARYYDGVRLTILNAILSTTPEGYRSSDARLLVGAIYWKQGRAADAVQSWSGMIFDAEAACKTACAEILQAIRAASGNASMVDPTRIDQILQAEHQRWIDFSTDRLRRFGYAADTF